MSERDGERSPTIPVVEEPADEEPVDRSIEPGTPKVEHVAFVVMGMVLTVLVFLRGLGFL